MYRRRNTRHYAQQIAKEFGVTVEQANTILSYAMKNIMKMMKSKEDIRLTGMGRLWVDKPFRPRPKKHAPNHKSNQ